MLDELRAVARRIKQHYVSLQVTEAGRPWSTAETMLGFTDDVGTLSRLVMEHEHLRNPRPDLDSRIEHELAACLWSVLTLADELGVDLQAALDHLDKNVAGRNK